MFLAVMSYMCTCSRLNGATLSPACIQFYVTRYTYMYTMSKVALSLGLWLLKCIVLKCIVTGLLVCLSQVDCK